MLAAPAHCQWPTLDLSQVTNMINGWTAQIESTSSTIQSTLSVGNIQQQIGDAVGGLSKFADAKEQAEMQARLEQMEAQRELALKMHDDEVMLRRMQIEASQKTAEKQASASDAATQSALKNWLFGKLN